MYIGHVNVWTPNTTYISCLTSTTPWFYYWFHGPRKIYKQHMSCHYVGCHLATLPQFHALFKILPLLLNSIFLKALLDLNLFLAPSALIYTQIVLCSITNILLVAKSLWRWLLLGAKMWVPISELSLRMHTHKLVLKNSLMPLRVLPVCG